MKLSDLENIEQAAAAYRRAKRERDRFAALRGKFTDFTRVHIETAKGESVFLSVVPREIETAFPFLMESLERELLSARGLLEDFDVDVDA